MVSAVVEDSDSPAVRLEKVLRWLWVMAFASVGDLSRMTGYTEASIATMLLRHKEIVERIRVGRGSERVYRYFFRPAGVLHMELAYGLRRSWQHSPSALKLLFERLEFVAFCYRTLPDLPGSNLSGSLLSISVPDDELEVAEEWRGRIQRVELAHDLRLVDLIWCQGARIDLVAVYESEENPSLRIYLPVTYYGSYQRPSDVSSWQAEMEEVLTPGNFWGVGSPEQRWFRYVVHCDKGVQPFRTPDSEKAKAEICYPSLLIVVPNPVIGLKVVREELRKDAVDIGVVDLSGQVLKPLRDFCVYWSGIRERDGRVSLQGFEAMLVRFETSHWQALNGEYEWRIFKWMHDYPGTGLDEILAGCGAGLGTGRPVTPRTGGRMVKAMVDAKLVWEVRGQYYLLDQGLIVYAQSEGVRPERLRSRLGKYSEPVSAYRDQQSVHNLKVAQVAVVFLQVGRQIYSGVHTVWDFKDPNTQVKPDLMVMLPSPYYDEVDFVSVEVERNAAFLRDLMDKLSTYRTLENSPRDIGMPSIFITETKAAAIEVYSTAWGYKIGAVATDFALFFGGNPLQCYAHQDVHYERDEPPDPNIYWDRRIDHFVMSTPYPHWKLTVVPFENLRGKTMIKDELFAALLRATFAPSSDDAGFTA